jgi:CHAD domain-containing protein
MPTIRSLGLTESAIIRHKPEVLQQLRDGICDGAPRPGPRHWHDRRILLKRYHHTLELFSFCPGYTLDEKELMQIKVLEQLLGDWHDRVVAIEILRSFTGREAQAAAPIAALARQERLLLGSARIYLAKFALYEAGR